MITEIILGISLVLNAVLGVIIFRGAKKMLQFDDLLGLLEDDLVANVKYFDKLVNTPILQNSPEILDAQKNMRVMKDRMDEFVLRIGETTSRTQTKEGNG